MADRKDPYRKFRFAVQVDSVLSGGFSEVSGFDASIDVVEYREGDEVAITPRKLPGLAKYGNVTLKRGVTDSMDMFNWIQGFTENKIVRKDITIIARDEANNEVATFQIRNAWPTKYTGPDFNATASEVTIESLEFAHEGMKRTK
ncbi:phage tail protein [Tumebacillus permanentifrigoris]|uniref:Phage tail-like protein n=1 Tax=Tumebacillus permanentifrigoris TaxID=378543 RepID=A0A316D9B4_9BACL|nr:phage tail protein [Tumebacillus permanentifrigoris]PWK11522.1 phage tail-like protein [Tumebacillus permanentifrigoris]